MSERHNVIDLFSRRPLNSPEARAAMIQELADLDAEHEAADRRRELLRRQLGLLGVEHGLGDGA